MILPHRIKKRTTTTGKEIAGKITGK